MFDFIFQKVSAAGIEIAPPTTGVADGTIGAFADLSSLVNFVINLVFGVGLALALLFVIIGGIKYITSQGEEGKAKEARDTITNAVIGAVVIIAFRVLINLGLSLLGVGGIETFLTT